MNYPHIQAANRDVCQPAPPPKQQPDLDRHLDELYQQVSTLEDRFAQLNSRLELSMRPCVPEKKESAMAPMPANHYCGRVYTLNERISALSRLTESTLDRLAV